ncbi:uncharacterized protein LOC103524116 [Trichonephila clavipes]|nr:uncharacterized protein LOC103524116 [Trichonephila clavipes]
MLFPEGTNGAIVKSAALYETAVPSLGALQRKKAGDQLKGHHMFDSLVGEAKKCLHASGGASHKILSGSISNPEETYDPRVTRWNLKKANWEIYANLRNTLLGNCLLDGNNGKALEKMGSSQNVLTSTFTSYVGPVIDYGPELLVTASDNALSKLNTVQNKAHRFITGAATSTPIAAMQLQTEISGSSERRQYIALSLESLSAWSDTFDGEIFVMFMAFRAISVTPGQNIVIFIDSWATIKIISGYNLFPSELEFKYRQLLDSFLSTGREVILQCIRSHCGIHGNEQVDKLAKETLTLHPPCLWIPLRNAK